MLIHYMLNGKSIYYHNMNAVPRVGDKIEISTVIFMVKDVVWHIEKCGTWVEVSLK